MQEKKVAPFECEGCSAERCFNSQFLQLPVLQWWQNPVKAILGLRLPRAVNPDTALSHACLSGTLKPWEIDILSYFNNCSLISCSHNRPTILTCSRSCCRCAKNSTLCSALLSTVCYLLHFVTGDKVNLSAFLLCTDTTGKGMKWLHFAEACKFSIPNSITTHLCPCKCQKHALNFVPCVLLTQTLLRSTKVGKNLKPFSLHIMWTSRLESMQVQNWISHYLSFFIVARRSSFTVVEIKNLLVIICVIWNIFHLQRTS